MTDYPLLITLAVIILCQLGLNLWLLSRLLYNQRDRIRVALSAAQQVNQATTENAATILARLENQDTVMLAQHQEILERVEALSQPVTKPPLNVVPRTKRGAN